MTQETRSASSDDEALKRQRAYREVNRLIVGAGIILASAGVPTFAPPMKALKAALRAVNWAGGIEKPKTPSEKEVLRAYPAGEGRRFRRAVP